MYWKKSPVQFYCLLLQELHKCEGNRSGKCCALYLWFFKFKFCCNLVGPLCACGVATAYVCSSAWNKKLLSSVLISCSSFPIVPSSGTVNVNWRFFVTFCLSCLFCCLPSCKLFRYWSLSHSGNTICVDLVATVCLLFPVAHGWQWQLVNTSQFVRPFPFSVPSVHSLFPFYIEIERS